MRKAYYGRDPKQVSPSEIPNLLAVIDSQMRCLIFADELARRVWKWSCTASNSDPDRVADAEESVMEAYFLYTEQVKQEQADDRNN